MGYLPEFYLDGEDVRRVSTGEIVRGSRGRNGYLQVSVGPRNSCINVRYHRLKFVLAKGWLPPTVDHRDGDTGNNLLDNLRAATTVQQNYNRVGRRHGKGLPRCVYSTKKRFIARITVAGRRQSLGIFATPEEASRVVEAYLRELHGDFYREQPHAPVSR